MSDVIESTVNAEPVVNVEPQTEVQETSNTEQVETTESVPGEVATPQQNEKPVQDAETNSMYAKIRREAEAKAKDEAIAEMGMEWNGKPITTYNQYKQALVEKAEQDRRAALEEQGIDPSIIDKYVDENPTVKQAREMMAELESKRAKEADYNSFIETYPDVKPADIPVEVWEQNEKGVSLVDAYTKYENKLLKQQLAEFKKGQQAQQSNANNASSSTGSVTGQGAVPNSYFTRDQVEAMSVADVNKNYKAIIESQKRWK